MAGRLFGTAGVGNSQAPEVAGFKVQTSVYGLPIPIVYGAARVAGNLIHFAPFDPVAQLSEGSHSKLVKVDQTVTGFLYRAALALALSEGPIQGIGKVWRDKDPVATFPGDYQPQGWSLFTGTASQAAWSYLTTNRPSEAVPYQLTAYVAHALLELPNNVLSNYTWEVLGLLPVGGGILDANPGAILTDVLTNADHGVGFPAAQLASLTAYTTYCTAAGLFLSPALTGQAPLADQLQQLVDATNSAFVWSGGQLQVLPYADQPITGHGVTYTPNVTPLYDLTDDDFLASPGEDPIRITRKKPSDCFNQLVVEYEDRAHDYNPNTQEFKDQASIDAIAAANGGSGLRPAPALRFPAIKDADTARYVAQLKGQREIAVRNQYAFTLGMKYALLEPMDLVTLTDVGLGLSLTPVRLIEIVDDGSENLQCVAEDFPAGVATASRYGSASANGTTPASTPPGNTNAPVIFQPPAALAIAPLELWIAASGGVNWGGCDVYVSADNVSFQKVGSVVGRAIHGTLTSALASAAVSPPNDTTHTLAVDVSAARGQLLSVSATDLAARVSLCYVDGEFLAYQTATLTGSGLYSLTTLARGLYGSPIASSHAIGAAFVKCDAALLKLSYPQGKAGQTLYFKFPAFNGYGAGLQDIAGLTSVAYTIPIGTPIVTGAGAPVAEIAYVSDTATDETVQLNGLLGLGATGVMSWSYQVGTATPVTGSGGLPFNITVPRFPKKNKVVTLVVTQADGQSDAQYYTVRGALSAIDETSGQNDRAVPHSDGNFAVAGNTTDAAGYTLHPSVLQQEGSQGRKPLKGYQSGTARDTQSITFSPAFASPPMVVFSRGNGTVTYQPTAGAWTLGSGAYSSGAAQIEDIYAQGLSAAGFTCHARLRQAGGTTAAVVDFPGGNNLTANNTATQLAVGAHAPSSSGHYAVSYIASVTTESSKPGIARTAAITVVINKRAGGSGGAITELRRDTYSVTDPDGTGPYTNASGVVTCDVTATLGTTDYLEVAVVGFTHTGSILGADSFSVHGCVNAADGVSGLAFTYGTGDAFASMTPNTGDTVRWEAYSVQ